MNASPGIRSSIQSGFAFFTVVQFFLLIAIAIFSYHYGEDQSLKRAVTSGASIVDYATAAEAPESLASHLVGLQEGIHELSGNDKPAFTGMELHVHVKSDTATGTSYRVLQIPEESRWWPLLRSYGLFALLSILLLLAFGGWAAHTIAQRISVPLEKLAGKIAVNHPARPRGGGSGAGDGLQHVDFSSPQQSGEVRLVAQTLNDAMRRIQSAIDRESTFARNVSHELRTPLTVIQTALEQPDGNRHGLSDAAIERARQACDEMELLTGACLELAREPSPQDHPVCTDTVACIKQIVRESLHLLDGKSVQLDLSFASQRLDLPVANALVRLVTGNIIRNAFIHCGDGDINIALSDRTLTVCNVVNACENRASLDHAPDDVHRKSISDTGYGVGLSILGQACQRLGWHFELNQRVESRQARKFVIATVYFA